MFEVVSNTLEVKILALVLTLNVLVTSRKIVSKKKMFFILIKLPLRYWIDKFALRYKHYRLDYRKFAYPTLFAVVCLTRMPS